MAASRDEIIRAFDDFGREVVVEARDGAISWFDGIMELGVQPVRETAAPEVQATQADWNALAQLPPETRALFRRLMIGVVNETVHHVLWRLSDAGMSSDAKLTYGAVELMPHGENELGWPALFGGAYTERGWYARFSRYGERGNEPAK
jgi:hypothetical protein